MPLRHFRLAILWSRFGPYHLARLKAAGGALAARGGTVTGIEVARSDNTYDWAIVDGGDGFARRTLFPDARYEDRTAREIARAVGAALDDLRPDAVAINGWSVPEARAALKWCRTKGVKAILMSESKHDDKPRFRAKELIKRRLVGRFDAALVGGGPHRDYLVTLGFPADRIVLGYDVVDNGHFARGALRARADAGHWRTVKGLPEKYFFACTRFIARKNVSGLLRAYAAYRHKCAAEPWGLVIAGSGAELADYRQIVSELTIGGVIWPGFVQYEELPVYYGLASAFIHPALSEPWGLVVNEALASGLPVLCSRGTGARYELVDEGNSGALFDPCSIGGMADAMLWLASISPNRLAAMGKRSEQIAAHWEPERFGQGLLAAIFANGRPMAQANGVPALARLGPLMTEAKPAKDPIHIAACVDNSGFPSLYILLQSLKVTQNNNELHVSVLHNGLTKTRIQLIHEKFCGDGFTVEFIRVDPKEYFTGRPPYGLMAYARILLPDILKADRVLYIDTDIIVLDDLSDLFGSILHNCIGVVKTGIAGKSNCYSYLKERGFGYYDDYFNSGVILIDCKKWRDENCTARLLRLGTLENWKFPTHDQTLLNAFFKGKFDALDKKYNYLCWSSATGSAIDEVVQNVMIHFIGRPKPWEFGGRLCFSYAIYIKLKRRMEMQAAPVEPADLWWSGRRIARYASSYGKLLKKRGINRYLHARKLIGVG